MRFARSWISISLTCSSAASIRSLGSRTSEDQASYPLFRKSSFGFMFNPLRSLIGNGWILFPQRCDVFGGVPVLPIGLKAQHQVGRFANTMKIALFAQARPVTREQAAGLYVFPVQPLLPRARLRWNLGICETARYGFLPSPHRPRHRCRKLPNHEHRRRHPELTSTKLQRKLGHCESIPAQTPHRILQFGQDGFDAEVSKE